MEKIMRSIFAFILVSFMVFSLSYCGCEEKQDAADSLIDFNILQLSGNIRDPHDAILLGYGWLDSLYKYDFVDVVNDDNTIVGKLQLLYLAPHYSIYKVSNVSPSNGSLFIRIRAYCLQTAMARLGQVKGRGSEYIDSLIDEKRKYIVSNGIQVIDNKYFCCPPSYYNAIMLKKSFTINIKGQEIAFKYIEPGSVRLGVPPGRRVDNEMSANLREWKQYNPTVHCTYPYWIMSTEYPAVHYKKYACENGVAYEGELIDNRSELIIADDDKILENLAAGRVRYYDAISVAEWLEKELPPAIRESFQLRIPTLLEHRHAAHANSSHEWWWGDLDSDANKYEALSLKEGAFMKRGKMNMNGLFDMYGNVSEWVIDRYSSQKYYSIIDGTYNPIGDITCVTGSCVYGGSYEHSNEVPSWLGGFSTGEGIAKTSPYANAVGFRLVLSPVIIRNIGNRNAKIE